MRPAAELAGRQRPRMARSASASASCSSIGHIRLSLRDIEVTVQAPVDPRDVAGRLVELALGEPAGRAPGYTVGSRTWDQFLTAQLRQQATTTAGLPGSGHS